MVGFGNGFIQSVFRYRAPILRAIDGVVLQAVRPVHRRPALRLRAPQIHRALQELYRNTFIIIF